MAKALLIGITRDRGPIVENFTKCLFSEIESTDMQWDVLFYENDSKDDTVAQFEQALQSTPDNVESARIVSETLDTESFSSEVSVQRIANIANARNAALDAAGDLSQYSVVVWVDSDYLIHEGVLQDLVEEVVEGEYSIFSAYSLHADVNRPNGELFDKWATRAQQSDVWWNCTPIERLPAVVDVYSTFNGLAAFDAKGFVDGARFEPISQSAQINGLDVDVEWVSICEQFRSMGLDKIALSTNSKVYHFLNAENIATADLNLLKN